MSITWTALIFVFLLVVFTVALIVKKYWPRDENGEMIDPDEIKAFMNKFPEPPKRSSMNTVIVFLATITLIALALSHKSNAGSSNPLE